MRRALFLTLTALLIGTSVAGAQTVPSPFRYVETTQSASVFAGYLWTGEGEHGLWPQDAPLLGALYTIRFSGPLSGEVMLGAAPSQRTVFQRTSAPTDSVQLAARGDVNSLLLTGEAGLRFHLTGARTWRGIMPFVATGVGIAADVLRGNELEETIEETQRVDLGPAFAVSVGAGTDWFLTERLSLRLEGRDHLWRVSIPEGLTNTRRAENEWTHNLGVTLGVALHF